MPNALPYAHSMLVNAYARRAYMTDPWWRLEPAQVHTH
jgi:hypothetical protein